MNRAVDSAVTAKGQATIPKAIREYLGLKPGDRVKFFKHPDGTVVLLPKRPAREFEGLLRDRAKGRRVTIEDMNEAIVAGATSGEPRRRR